MSVQTFIVLNILSTMYSICELLKKSDTSEETNFQQGNVLQKSIWSPARRRTDKKVSSELEKILSSFAKVTVSKKCHENQRIYR